VNRCEEDRLTSKNRVLAALGLLIAALALVAAGCGGDDDGGAEVTALPSSSCTGIEYEGEGDPDVLIASDLPMQGASKIQTDQMVAAIRQVLDNYEWKAGDYNVAYQVCDDSTAQAANYDTGKCSQNGNAYAVNDSLVSVIGTYNSPCAAIIIPLLNKAKGGVEGTPNPEAIAMMSPANTWPCLTVNLAGGCEANGTDKYYPTGTRNYLRVAPSDDYQGAFIAEFAKKQGVTKAYILNDKESYGLGVAGTTRKAMESVGIEIVGDEAWNPKASSYEALMNKIKGTGADAIFLGGLIAENGGQVIEDKVAVLGPNDGAVKLFGPDGFATQSTIDESGGAAAGMFLSNAGVPIDKITEDTQAAQEFVAQLQEGALADKPIEPYAVYAGQAAEVVLDAIAASDGTRASILENMFSAQVTDGLIGSFSFNENGDPEDASGAVVAFTMYKATTELESVESFSPSPETVAAAQAG
jgi:branched-chain amino acid transport system substrate-binding protein